MTFDAGVDRLDKGDPSGLDTICIAGFQGDARAQYFYGVYLLRRGPAQTAASLAWLRRAAAQDHKAARHVLAQLTGRPLRAPTGPSLQPRSVPPPAIHACLTGPRPGRPAAILEAKGDGPELRG